MKIFKGLLVMLLAVTFIQTAAMAAESRPKYKKATGQVVSANPSSIVLKGRTKQLTAAINAGTEIIGAKAAKAGDTATVNYRADKNGNTATKIKVVAQASEKPVSAPATAHPAPLKAN